MRSTMSAFVIVMEAVSRPQVEGEALPQPLEYAGMHDAHLVVGQRPVRRTIRDRVCEALLARGDGRTAVAVEQSDRLDARISQRTNLLEDGSGRERLVNDNCNVARDGRKSGYGPQLDAARTIVGENFDVKLADPHFLCKIAGLRDFWMQGPGHADGRTGDLDHGGLAGLQERLLADRPPPRGILLEAESSEDVLDDALQVREIDRRPDAFEAARRPCAAQYGGERARLLANALRVHAVALADLEGTHEVGPERDIGGRGADEARERRPTELAGLRREGVLDREGRERPSDEAGKPPVRRCVGKREGHH